MTMRQRLARLLVRLSPPRWRDSIAGDFEEESGGVREIPGALVLIGRLWFEHARHAQGGGGHPMQTIHSVVRDASRAVTRRPAHAVILIATLAVGIGASTAVFTLANWLMLRPLPGVTAPDRLVTMRLGSGLGNIVISQADVRTLSDELPMLGSIAGSMEASFNLAAPPAEAARVQGAIVSTNYFDALGLRPALGRAFAPGETGVVVSDGYWRSRLGASSEALRRTILVNGHAVPLIGVVPRGFSGLSRSSAVDVWVPDTLKTALFPGSRGDTPVEQLGMYIDLFGRLVPGASVEDVSAVRERAMAAVAGAHPAARYARVALDVDRGLSEPLYQRSRFESLFTLLMAMVALLVVLTCANVGNIVLAAGAGRQTEFATRQALGAPRSRIVAVVLTECLLLSMAGGVAAVGVAAAAGGMMRGTIVLPFLAALGDIGVDRRVFVFALALSAGAALVAGALGALAATRVDLLASLKASGRSIAASTHRVRKVLLVAQVALSLTLLIGGVLLARSVDARRRVNPGFDPAPIMSFSVEPGLHSRDEGRRAAFYANLVERVQALPGVERAALGWSRPFSNMANEGEVRAVGGPTADMVPVEIFTVSGGYFETMGIPLLAGRDFDSRDPGENYKKAGSVILSQTTATQLFGSPAAAIDRQIAPDYPAGARRHVVGVVGDARLRKAFAPSGASIFYHLGAAAPWATVHVRLAGGAAPETVAPLLRQTLQHADATLPAYDVLTARDAIEAQMTEDVLVGRVTLTFAVIATLLAAIGLYGVMSQWVTERRVEIGIRGALGAAPGRVLGMIAASALRTTAIGAVVGLALTFSLGRFIEARLFGVSPFDPAAYAAALAIVVIVALLSAAIPARRASRVDPVTALRH